jgi:hypothetical protein
VCVRAHAGDKLFKPEEIPVVADIWEQIKVGGGKQTV